jgi:hypothetical protein
MTKKLNNRFIISLIIIVFSIFGLVKPIYPQSSAPDSSFHPYHVNYWITGGIIVGGLTLEKIGVGWITDKSHISLEELQNLSRTDITAIDKWALNLDPSKKDYYEKLSDQLLSFSVFFPFLTMLDSKIRQDWLDILLMYMQCQTITNNFYLYSPFGATFQNRLRPVVYYDAVAINDRTTNNNRNSLYSGHTAVATEAAFFTAKIFCDYHPELGWNKYLVYGAAAIPSLLIAYFRVKALSHFPTDVMVGLGVGALCGILIPELHRMDDSNISVGMYSSSEATGIAIQWQPNFLK